MVELIHQFADIISNIERLANKQITIQVDFPHDDFPRETSERLEVISRCDKYLHALNVKDHMLWSSLKDKDSIQELLTEERRLNHEYAEEVAHWAEMSQTLSNQILELKQDKQIMERRNRELINILQKNNIYYMSDD